MTIPIANPPVMWTATCITGGCTEEGTVKEGRFVLLETEHVLCGACGKECTVTPTEGDSP